MGEAWIDSIIPEKSEFTIENLPWGVFTDETTPGSICVGIGNHIVDVHAWALSWTDELGFGEDFALKVKDALLQRTLNAFLDLGKEHWITVRKALKAALLAYNPHTLEDPAAVGTHLRLVPMEEVTMLLPLAVGDYTDFYCSKEHATHVGTMFRGKQNALNPNWLAIMLQYIEPFRVVRSFKPAWSSAPLREVWKDFEGFRLHMPIGYHGRASSIVVSGASVPRPWGQVKGDDGPLFRPSEKLDFELELACVLGSSTSIGSPVKMQQAARHIFGYMLMNDCSARDIQQWEYVPLGPFNGKNFATVLSPWVVQHEALAPFACAAPEQDPEPLPYLQDPARVTFDLTMKVEIKPEFCEEPFTVSTARFRDLYWTFEQMLTHHTVSGCNITAGDIIASGTVSSEGEGAQGCLLELTENGKRPLQLSAGCQRTWLHNGDTVCMTATADNGLVRIGFGPCKTTVTPAVMYRT